MLWPVSLSASSAPVIDSGTVSMMIARVDPALELRREHQVDERQRQQEGDVEAAGGGAELPALPVESVTTPAGRFAAASVQEGQRLAERVARRQGCRQRRRAQLVEVVELLRGHGLLDAHQVGQRHHLAVAAADEDLAQVVRVGTVDVLELHDDVVLLARPA